MSCKNKTNCYKAYHVITPKYQTAILELTDQRNLHIHPIDLNLTRIIKDYDDYPSD